MIAYKRENKIKKAELENAGSKLVVDTVEELTKELLK